MEPIRVYVGSDKREQVGLHVFCESVWSRASVPVSITPLTESLSHLWGGQRDSSNQFIYGRFLIPYLQNWKGWAIFADGSDMILQEDINELWKLRDDWKAVQVVKHDYKTKHPVKYLGGVNEDMPRKNWSSLMLINAGHFSWRQITPEYVAKATGANLHRFQFIDDKYIGGLPKEWNWLDEFGPNNKAKIIHMTLGLPVWEPYKKWWHSDIWHEELKKSQHFQEWGGNE
jgi:hypothetical protein